MALAFQGVTLLDDCFEHRLVLGKQPHMASHQDKRVDSLGKRNMLIVEISGILGKKDIGLLKRFIRFEEFPLVAEEIQGQIYGLVLGHFMKNGRFRVDLHILIPLFGNVLGFILDRLNHLCCLCCCHDLTSSFQP